MKYGHKSTTEVPAAEERLFAKEFLQPARKTDETYEQYKARRTQGNQLIRRYLKGNV